MYYVIDITDQNKVFGGVIVSRHVNRGNATSSESKYRGSNTRCRATVILRHREKLPVGGISRSEYEWMARQ